MASPPTLFFAIGGEGCYCGQLPVLPGMDALIAKFFFSKVPPKNWLKCHQIRRRKHCYLKSLELECFLVKVLHVQGKKPVFRTRYCGSFVTEKYERKHLSPMCDVERFVKVVSFSESADAFVISSIIWTFDFPFGDWNLLRNLKAVFLKHFIF